MFSTYILFHPDTLSRVASEDILHQNKRRGRGRRGRQNLGNPTQRKLLGWWLKESSRITAVQPAQEKWTPIGARGWRSQEGCPKKKWNWEEILCIYMHSGIFSVVKCLGVHWLWAQSKQSIKSEKNKTKCNKKVIIKVHWRVALTINPQWSMKLIQVKPWIKSGEY